MLHLMIVFNTPGLYPLPIFFFFFLRFDPELSNLGLSTTSSRRLFTAPALDVLGEFFFFNFIRAFDRVSIVGRGGK